MGTPSFFQKLPTQLIIGLLIGSAATFIIMKMNFYNAGGSAMHSPLISYRTGVQYIEECTGAPPAYYPGSISNMIEATKNYQSCWSFIEATVDTLERRGISCAPLDGAVQRRVNDVAKESDDTFQSGAGILHDALFKSGVCWPRK